MAVRAPPVCGIIAALAKLSKGEDVNTSILVKICDALGCGIRDIVDSVPEVRLKHSPVGKGMRDKGDQAG